MKNNASVYFPFFPILGLIFITLKLTGFIGWSWWWVLAPLWGPLALAAVIISVVGIFMMATGNIR